MSLADFLPRWRFLSLYLCSALAVGHAVAVAVRGDRVALPAWQHASVCLLLVVSVLAHAYEQARRARDLHRIKLVWIGLCVGHQSATETTDRAYFRGGCNALAVALRTAELITEADTITTIDPD